MLLYVVFPITSYNFNTWVNTCVTTFYCYLSKTILSKEIFWLLYPPRSVWVLHFYSDHHCVLCPYFNTDRDSHWGLTGTKRERETEKTNRKKDINSLATARAKSTALTFLSVESRDISVHSEQWWVTNYSSNIRFQLMAISLWVNLW